MRILTEATNPTVITEEQMKSIIQLIYSTPFRGSTDWEDESLFQFGWIYDENTNIVITTRKQYTWDCMNSPLRFRVFKLNEDTIDVAYSKDEELMLCYNNNLGPWESLFTLDKLHYLETLDSFLTKHSEYTEYSIEELVEYLTKYVNTHYQNLKP